LRLGKLEALSWKESVPVANVVKPVVWLFFLCDEAMLELEDGKWWLKRPWPGTVTMPPGVTHNHCQEELWLYAQMSGGVGTFHLSVQLVNEDGQVIGRTDPPITRELSGGNEWLEEVWHWIDVPFDRPGLYEFRLVGNYAELDGGTVHLRVLPG
jgi:hypothetical protein